MAHKNINCSYTWNTHTRQTTAKANQIKLAPIVIISAIPITNGYGCLEPSLFTLFLLGMSIDTSCGCKNWNFLLAQSAHRHHQGSTIHSMIEKLWLFVQPLHKSGRIIYVLPFFVASRKLIANTYSKPHWNRSQLTDQACPMNRLHKAPQTFPKEGAISFIAPNLSIIIIIRLV